VAPFKARGLLTHPSDSTAAAAIAATLVFAGCGPDAGTDARDAGNPVRDSEERRAARAIERLERAINARDATRVCEHILARKTTGRRCIRDLEMLFRHPVYQKFDVTVRDVTINGRTGHAQVVLRIRGQARKEWEIYRVIKERGEWRVGLPLGG
jgi:hypothetical protein